MVSTDGGCNDSLGNCLDVVGRVAASHVQELGASMALDAQESVRLADCHNQYLHSRKRKRKRKRKKASFMSSLSFGFPPIVRSMAQIFDARPAPQYLRYGERLYMRPGLSVRRRFNRLWITASTFGFGSSSLLSAYEDNPGCWPGAQVEWFSDRVKRIKEDRKRSQSTWTVSVKI